MPKLILWRLLTAFTCVVIPVSQTSAADAQKQSNSSPAASSAKDFFHIHSVSLLKKVPKDTIGVWTFKERVIDGIRRYPIPDQFQQCLEVRVSTEEDTRSDATVARAHFFDENNRLLASQLNVSKAGDGKSIPRNHFGMPVLFKKNTSERFFFEVPGKIREKKWKAIVVFGDQKEMKSACYPSGESDFLLEYPERYLVYNRKASDLIRKLEIDPLVEHVVKTPDLRVPQITMFLRFPRDTSDAGEIKGVLAVCVLANNIEYVRRKLRVNELDGDYRGLFEFANRHKLAIIAWGAKELWDPSRNYSELSSEEKRELDATFDVASNAWERGVLELAKKYELPTKNFLLWGACGSAQWAHRLCLRKPKYFLAINIHIPGSFDQPTPEGYKVLWCLTTGELYDGYERSKRFVIECKKLGYPIIFKAIVGLGHTSTDDTAALGFEFFEFALTQKEMLERNKMETSARLNLPGKTETPKYWAPLFLNPPFYGDFINQEVFPADQVEMIPEGFRIPLPTKKIAEIWARSR